MSEPVRLPTDPRNRQELADWLRRRGELFDGNPPPLSAREYLMVQRLQSARAPYSIT